MTWNYRVCSRTVGNGDFRQTVFEIHEVYYNEDGEVDAYGRRPEAPFGETAIECVNDAARMADCLALGVLDLDALDERWGRDQMNEVRDE